MSDRDAHLDEGGDPACWSHLFDDEGALVADLRARLNEPGDGVHWTLEPDSEMNVNLVRLDPGHLMAEHVNDDVDVLVVVLAGGGHIVLGTRTVPLHPNGVAHVPKGLRRSIEAGPDGLTYLTVHRRREGLTIRQP